MWNKTYELKDFQNIGTVVFYKERSFKPELGDTSNITELLSSQALHPSSLYSEYIDFAKYDFKFKLEQEDFWSFLKPNLYNYIETRNLLGEDFGSVCESLVPQLSSLTTENEEKHFFGQVKFGSNLIYFLDVPEDIWKVEIYGKLLNTNNSFLSDHFIDYDYGNDIIEAPVMSIYFGPKFETRLQDISYIDIKNYSEYYNRYGGLLTQNTYNSFKESLSISKYKKIISEEIYSRKMLYLVVNTSAENALTSIDVLSATFPLSKNKFRNLKKNAFRNDDKTATCTSIFSPDKLVFDTRSKTLLGIKREDSSKNPLFVSRYNKLSSLIYSDSAGGNKVKVNGEIYTHDISPDVFGDNPEISPYWISEKHLGKSIFKRMYIYYTGKGFVSPSGEFLTRANDLYISAVPSKGYVLSEVSGVDFEKKDNGVEIIPENDTRVIIVFSEKEYPISFLINCEKDYTEFGKKRSIGLEELLEKGVELWYFDYNVSEFIQYSIEQGPIILTDTKPFCFVLRTNGSLYDETSLNCPIAEEGYYIYTVSGELPDNPEEAIIHGDTVCRTYQIIYDTPGKLQNSLNKPISVLEYGSEYKIKFAFEPDESEVVDINKFRIYRDDVEEKSGIWSLTQEGNVVTFYIPARTETNLEAGVKNNYLIRYEN